MALHNSMTRMTQIARSVPSTMIRQFASTPAPALTPEREKRFVRIAGPSSYASKEDVTYFLQQHGIPLNQGPKSIVQGQSDVFQNHSIWVLETESQNVATDIASRISGRVLGLKLIRAAPVDQKLYDGLLGPGEQRVRSTSLRKRMSVIAPTREERGRALLARNLQSQLHPRALWSFFSAYDVVDVRHLRRSGVACIVFKTEEEANRALRERNNISLQHQQTIVLKIHE